MAVDARRCKEHTRDDNCETFTSFTITDFCDRLEKPGMMGYRYMSKINPRLRCPAKVGTYNVDAVDIFFGRLLDLPVEGYRWIIKASIIGKAVRDKGGLKVIGCILLNARIMASTSRKRVMKASDVFKVLT